MRLSRLVPALAAGALLVAGTSPVLAQEADPVDDAVAGLGTTTGSLTLLGLDAGDLLSLDLLSDAGIANTDRAAGAESAAAQIAAFALTSQLLDIAQSVPLLAVESTGEEQTASQDVAIPSNPIASGSALPLDLSAVVGEDGARSSLTGKLADLDVLGGILGLTGADLGLGSSALTADAAATRGVSVQDLSVLDLEALLAGLGIPLTDLPLETLLGLLDGLGLLDQLPLDALGIDLDDVSVDGLLGTVDGLLGQIGDLDEGLAVLETLEAGLTGASPVCTITDAAEDLLGGLLGGSGSTICSTTQTLTEQLATVRTQITALTDQLDAVLDQIRGLLTGTGGVLDLLGGTALLSVSDLELDVVTKATDDVATSVADVTASLGTLQVGALPAVGGLDLGAPTAQIDAVLGQVQDAVGGVLGQIAPSLTDLVTVSTLDEQTSVVEDAGKVLATAELTGLVVEVQPVLAEIEALLAGLGGAGSLGDTLEGLGLPVPTSGATEVLALNSLLAPVTDGLPLLGGLAALDEALTLQVASVRQQSAFTAGATPVAPGTPAAPGAPSQTPAPTLPRTGSGDTLLLALAAGAVLAALGGRQLLRRSAG